MDIIGVSGRRREYKTVGDKELIDKCLVDNNFKLKMKYLWPVCLGRTRNTCKWSIKVDLVSIYVLTIRIYRWHSIHIHTHSHPIYKQSYTENAVKIILDFPHMI